MSELKKLVKKLCPDGVEYKTLGEIGKVSMCKRIMKNQTNSQSGVPFFKIGTFGRIPDSYISFELFNEYKQKYSYPKKSDVLISASGTIGRTVIFDGKPAYFQDSNIVWIDNDETIISNKYLYYFYQTNPWRISEGGIIARLYNDDLAKIKIPVPPIEVQHEIVRILDSFTEYTALLEKELNLRKKQYAYYRDKLLTFGDDIEYKTLHELCFIVDYRGKTPEKTKEGIFLVTAKNIRKGYIDYECSKEYISEKDYNEVMHRGLPHKGDVLITTEAPLGNVAQIDNDKIALAQRVIKYRPKDSNLLLSEFLKYYLLSTEFQNKLLKASTGGTVKGIKGSKLHQLEIPVPPIEEQERIVKILDIFDTLCNDLTVGIPAEISARQKQYEYYRDRLLQFS